MLLHFTLLACLVPIAQAQVTSGGHKKGKVFTINSSQLVCSLPGPSGPPGLPGTPGPSGSMGRMGFPGKDGKDGEEGEQGEKGESGDQGRVGNPGRPGTKGSQGVVGKAGPRGRKGQRGDRGLAGIGGVKGQAGDEGQTGRPGGCLCGANGARSAFSVAVTKSYPKERLPIRFDRVLMNEGGHYNASAGKFLCAIPGVYYFTYDITLANKHLAIGLVHNGQYKIKTFDANTGNHDVASGSTVLRLRRGDEVWLQIFYAEQNGLFFDPYWTDSLFTGFLIYPDLDTPSVAEPAEEQGEVGGEQEEAMGEEGVGVTAPSSADGL
ncbi:complement C1q tumor necrosis factor-related protein 2 [Amia ocellicauda]|uniref:complement C1q tumor necrosis factor-related protein 2 n=1 Tax=Amia ocellicauda TaxID=2972642 RepID=UPI0034641D5C